MNFLHAVDHLNRGDCKAINRKFWGSKMKVQLYVGCLRFYYHSLGNWILSDSFNLIPKDYMADDWYLIEPVTSAESVQTPIYAVVNKKDGNVLATFMDKSSAKVNCSRGLSDGTLILAEASVKVDKPVPLKQWHRKEVIIGEVTDVPKDAQFFAEWQE